MKRIGLGSLASLTLLTALASQVFATPNPNSAFVKTRIFNDCPFTTLNVVNNYPSLISFEETGLGCFAFANLHNWSFSTDGTTAAPFPNNSDFRASATLVINGSGNGEAGLRLSPWWSPDVDGRFNVRTTDGEIACFGGRLPFFSFTGAYGLHYTKGQSIRLTMTYRPHALSASGPATMEYTLTYQGNTYSSGALNFDQGNPSEDPPHGQWGLLNDGYVGGYTQNFNTPGDLTASVTTTFTDIRFVICPIDPDPTNAVVQTRVFNDCPPATVNVVNNYPSLISFEEIGLACSGFANLDVWTYADPGGVEVALRNDDDFRIACDFVLTGRGEGGLRVSPWWGKYADGLFNVRSTDGEIAVFGGRLPFYSFTGAHGLTYTPGETIHLEMIYRHNGLSSTSPGTMQYNLTYQGASYSSGPLTLDQGNPAEDPPYGQWGILNDARAGGHMKAFMTPGDFSATTKGTFTNIEFQAGAVGSVEIKPGTINFKSQGSQVTAVITPPESFGPADIDVSSLRLNGVAGPISSEIDGNKLRVKFSRAVLQSAVQNDNGTVTVTGDLGTICFTASGQVRVREVSSPTAGSSHAPGSTIHVEWDNQGLEALPADLYASFDGGETWTVIAEGIANDGSYDWSGAQTETNEAMIAVLVESPDGDAVGLSDEFTIQSPVGVGNDAVAEFALKGVSPNPSKGQGVNVSFSLANGRKATLSLYDVTGRRIAFRDVGVMGAGRHTVNLAQKLPAGMYVVQLSQDGRNLTTRAAVVR